MAMNSCKPYARISLVLLLFVAGYSSAASTAGTDYQYRGGRFEGIKPKPVSGYDIELTSFLADYREAAQQTPEKYKIKFYLNETPKENIYVTARDIDADPNYWMDRITPARPWQAGFNNIYEWPTDPVIKHLKGFTLYDIGVLVRIGSRDPSSEERVAPAILFHANAPRSIKGYFFTFKINGTARVSCQIYKSNASTPLWSQVFPRKTGSRPITVQWDSTSATRGFYKLLVTGYFLDSNRQFNQSVIFYHQPDEI